MCCLSNAENKIDISEEIWEFLPVEGKIEVVFGSYSRRGTHRS